MSHDSPPKRRWSFSLRTLFAVVTIACCLGWLAYSFAWARERSRIEAWDQASECFYGWSGRNDANRRAPGILWLFGATAWDEMTLAGHEVEDLEPFQREVDYVQQLFPEAVVSALIYDSAGHLKSKMTPRSKVSPRPPKT
jgi:hypothetical protein